MFNWKWWNYKWVFKEITKSFVFKYFQKTDLCLESIQTSKMTKMEPFVKIANRLMPPKILDGAFVKTVNGLIMLTIFTRKLPS